MTTVAEADLDVLKTKAQRNKMASTNEGDVERRKAATPSDNEVVPVES